jgi:hypothetical protein
VASFTASAFITELKLAWLIAPLAYADRAAERDQVVELPSGATVALVYHAADFRRTGRFEDIGAAPGVISHKKAANQTEAFVALALGWGSVVLVLGGGV